MDIISSSAYTVKIAFKSAFEDHLVESNTRGSGKARSYIRALDLLSEMLQKEPYTFSDCINIWSVSSTDRLDELRYFVIKEQNKSASPWQIEGIPVSYLKDRYCSAALASLIEFIPTYGQTVEKDRLSYHEANAMMRALYLTLYYIEKYGQDAFHVINTCLNSRSSSATHGLLSIKFDVSIEVILKISKGFSGFINESKSSEYSKLCQELYKLYDKYEFNEISSILVSDFDRPICQKCSKNFREIKHRDLAKKTVEYRNYCSSCRKKNKRTSIKKHHTSKRLIPNPPNKDKHKLLGATVVIDDGVYSGMKGKITEVDHLNSEYKVDLEFLKGTISIETFKTKIITDEINT